MWRNSGTPQPKCHEHKKQPRTQGTFRNESTLGTRSHKKLAKMPVVKDNFKPNFGRPFFVCSEKGNPCSFGNGVT